MVLTLYKVDGSPPVRSVRMTIEALGLQDVEYVNVNLSTAENLSEEYLKMNPQHTVPVLKDDDFSVWDSHAISIYLVTVYGSDDSLYPADPKKRAIINQRLHFDSGILFPALRGTVEPVFFFGETSFNPDNLLKISAGYKFAEQLLTGNDWMAGDEVTLADICCVSSITSMNAVLPIDRQEFPNLDSWLERCSELDFFIKGNLPGLADFVGLCQMKLGNLEQ